MSNFKKSAEYELDEVGEQERKDAFNDESDMRRMGKRQDFQVGSSDHLIRALQAD